MDSTTTASSITANVIEALNQSLAHFQTSLGCLNEERISQIRTDGESLIDSQINSVRTQMVASNQVKDAQIEDIDKLVKEIFEKELVAQLQSLSMSRDFVWEPRDNANKRVAAPAVTAGVLRDIDDLVKDEVAARLPEYMSEGHRTEMKLHEEELARLERELHNSESMRKNATLIPGDLDAEILTILNDEGIVPNQFPKTLDALFRISGTSLRLRLHVRRTMEYISYPHLRPARWRILEDDARGLLKEYGAPVKPSRDDNINAILDLVGASKIRMASPYGGPAILCSPTTAARAKGAAGSKI
ncbi:hypothetical protein ONZ51_g12974 [Trametes cubensis]|uniref:Uncharacterized protein n=1 Tax=Trametes cubensis TaxID=1111947 RepID=A0AAD7X6D5_9APHY|nr:hypothetical protein ONZ51_g12974 [Trametes cubensis]